VTPRPAPRIGEHNFGAYCELAGFDEDQGATGIADGLYG
jgi:hypothetical protein